MPENAGLALLMSCDPKKKKSYKFLEFSAPASSRKKNQLIDSDGHIFCTFERVTRNLDFVLDVSAFVLSFAFFSEISLVSHLIYFRNF